jgi:hypothetical protein
MLTPIALILWSGGGGTAELSGLLALCALCDYVRGALFNR